MRAVAGSARREVVVVSGARRELCVAALGDVAGGGLAYAFTSEIALLSSLSTSAIAFPMSSPVELGCGVRPAYVSSYSQPAAFERNWRASKVFGPTHVSRQDDDALAPRDGRI